ncbi:DAO-domain-containing protein [Mucidula mucida]|nr:DAO-domain-containing protein [Mucidula mucida]
MVTLGGFVVALSLSGVLAVPLEQQVTLQSSLARTPLPIANPTKSFWINSPGANPLAKEGSTGPLTTAADVCIIGSGMSGISAAYKLSEEAGLRVAVFEARDFCSAATGRNGGHLTTYVFQDFHNLANKYGVEQAKAGFALENYTSHAIVKIIEDEGLEDVVNLVHGGHTSIFMTEALEAKRRKDYEEALVAGMNLDAVKWHSKEEMKAAFGTSYPAITFDAYNFWPLKFVTQLYRLAKERSASTFGSLVLHTNTPVTGVLPSSDSGKWDLITLRGSVSCQYVLHATNAYAGHLLPSMRGAAGIIPTRGQVVAIKSKNTGISSWTNSQGEYWFPRPGGDPDQSLVILGGGNSAARGEEAPVTDDSVLNPRVGQALRKFFPKIFGVEEREPDMEWTGIMGYTAMGDPFVGPLLPLQKDTKGQYISAGLSGHGMPRAFSSAQAAASMIIADIKNETWEAPEWLPERYLTENRV